MTLEEIIEGCRRGNAEARRELYVRYGSPMYGVIRRYVSDASTAEDLLHDGFVTLYTRIGDYRGDGPFEGLVQTDIRQYGHVLFPPQEPAGGSR